MFVNTFIEKQSIVYDLNFWTKLVCFSLLLPLASFLSPTDLLPLLTAIFILVFLLSKINFLNFWKSVRVYILSITVGLAALSTIFYTGALQERIIYGAVLAVRFSLLISFGVLFSMVTNPIEIPSGFMQARIPHKYGVTLMVAYRMMPLLSKKITTIVNAQKARGASFKFSVKHLGKFFYQLASLMVPLLHSTLEMSVRLSDALISRGYDPDGEITITPAKSSFYDFLLVTLSTFALIICILW